MPPLYRGVWLGAIVLPSWDTVKALAKALKISVAAFDEKGR